MIIRKITFKNNPPQAWIVIEDNKGEYCGTWHTTKPNLVEWLRKENPTEIIIKGKEGVI